MFKSGSSSSSSSSSSTQDFTISTKKNTHSVKTSSIFIVANMLAQERNESVKDFDLLNPNNRIDRSDRQTLLLKYSPKKDAVNLYSDRGFNCTNRHLALDKFYSAVTSENGQMGFAAGHYSEKYVHPTTGVRISIHVYFSDQAPYIQVRQAENANAALKEVTEPLSPYFKNLILTNALEAERMFKTLSRERDERWLDKLRFLALLQEKLDSRTVSLQNANDYEKFYKLADKFVEGVKILNSLNEFEIDNRDKRILERVQYLKVSQEEAQREAKDRPQAAEPQQELEPTPAKSTEPTKAPEFNKVQAYQDKILAELAEMEKVFDKTFVENNPAKLIKLAAEIALLVCEGYFFKKLSAEQKKLISRVDAKIVPHICTVDYVYRRFQQGDVQGFKAGFASLPGGEQHKLVTHVFMNIVMPDEVSADLTDKQIEMCDYLNDNYAVYKKVFQSVDRILLHMAEEQFFISALVCFCLNGYIKTFEMFLRHGANPNWIGAHKNEKVLSMMKVILLLKQNPAEYVSLLLAHGVLVDIPPSALNVVSIKDLSNDISPAERKAMKKELFDKEKVQSLLSNLFSLVALHRSDLATADSVNKYDCAELLLEKSSFKDQAEIFADVSATNGIITRQIKGGEAGFDFFESKAAADAEARNYKIGPAGSLRLCFFPDPNLTNPNTPSQLDFAQNCILAMQRKLRQFSPAAVDAELLKMERLADNPQSNRQEVSLYLGCLVIVLLQNTPIQDRAAKLVKYSQLTGSCALKDKKLFQAQSYLGLSCYFAESTGLVNSADYVLAKKNLTIAQQPPVAAASSSASSSSNPKQKNKRCT